MSSHWEEVKWLLRAKRGRTRGYWWDPGCASVSQPSLPLRAALPLGCSLGLSWDGALGAAALVPLSPSAFGLGIVQGGVISQADVGVQGLPEPLTEEGLLPCGRCLREQEGAVERGQSWVGGLSLLPTPATQSLLSEPAGNPLVPCSLSHQTPAWPHSGLVLCCIPSCLPIHPGHLGVQACPVSMPALASLLVPPADPLSPGWPLSSDNAQWLPGVPEGDTPSPGSQGWVLLTLRSTFPFQGPLTCPALSSWVVSPAQSQVGVWPCHGVSQPSAGHRAPWGGSRCHPPALRKRPRSLTWSTPAPLPSPANHPTLTAFHTWLVGLGVPNCSSGSWDAVKDPGLTGET